MSVTINNYFPKTNLEILRKIPQYVVTTIQYIAVVYCRIFVQYRRVFHCTLFAIRSFRLKMPKNKPSMTCVISKYISKFGENVFSIDRSILFCKLCEIRVSADRRYIMTQHLKTDKHIREINHYKNATSKVQQQLTLCSKKSTFSKDICKVLLSANITLNKVNNKDFRLFMEKYTNKEIPNESTLCKSYVNDIYEESMNKIRSNIAGHKI